jgi:hypothetical protein
MEVKMTREVDKEEGMGTTRERVRESEKGGWLGMASGKR